MGILDPDGVRRRRAAARRGARAARRSSRSRRRSRFEQRVGFAFRIAAANIAEEVTNVVLRRGVDPRDFTLVAYGAAGPMLLPAALDLLHVRRVVVPPHPGQLLRARAAQHRPRLLRQPQRVRPALPGLGAADRRPCSRRWSAACASAPAGTATVRRSFDGRLFGQSWETPFVQVPDGPITRDDRRPGRALPRDVRAALRQPLPVHAGAGRQLPRRAARAVREGRVRAAQRRR